jgi:hypothetical protein
MSYKTHPNFKMTDVIYSSLCLPILFQPFFHENNIYIDGGCLCNYPLYQCIQQQNPENTDEILGINLYEYPLVLSDTNNLFEYLTHLIVMLITKSRSTEERNIKIKNEIIINDYPNLHEIINVMGNVEKRRKLLACGIDSVNQIIKETKRSPE